MILKLLADVESTRPPHTPRHQRRLEEVGKPDQLYAITYEAAPHRVRDGTIPDRRATRAATLRNQLSAALVTDTAHWTCFLPITYATAAL